MSYALVRDSKHSVEIIMGRTEIHHFDTIPQIVHLSLRDLLSSSKGPLLG